MPEVDAELLLSEFRRTLRQCHKLYTGAARQCVHHHPELISQTPDEFIELMDDLHKGLVVKIYVQVAEADRRWSWPEQQLAEVLFKHVWHRHLTGDALREAILHVSREATDLDWYSLIRPFAQLAPLRQHVGQLETVVMRLGNLVARADGHVPPSEAGLLRSLQAELDVHLRPVALDEPGHHEEAQSVGTQAVEKMQSEVSELRDHCQLETVHGPKKTDGKAATPKRSPQERLKRALAELDQLIGMDSVKQEVRTLTNFLKVQRQRTKLGLPVTDISLHMVFAGNPGTGKTTVARIVGEIFGAMGILEKGHLVETDRSGLVAEYAGQTGPKANKKVDEAIDGVLFVDEAYSLVADSGDDPFGREAVQALLKRMEDDRKRLVVILAGYPKPMDQLLRSNPGLTSRFQRTLSFDDYCATDLCCIFERMCQTNRYRLEPESRGKLLLAFQWLYEHRDEHFGNGRLVRNTFEDAIRRLADRVATVEELTKELLTQLEPVDIELRTVPGQLWERLSSDSLRFRVRCEGCDAESMVPMSYLGRRLKCNKCDYRFTAAWGQPCDVVD